MTPTQRHVLGMPIAPLAPIAVMLRGFDLASPAGRSGVAIYIMISYTMTLLPGIPNYLLLKLRQATTCAAYVAGAFLMGAAASPVAGFILVLWWTLSVERSVLIATAVGSVFAGIPVFGLLAAPTGLTFWLIARPDRP